MSENKMEYRGSKSDLKSKFNSVKEQRVDGTGHIIKKIICLRCILDCP